MPAGPSIERLQAPTGGLNTDAAPDAVAVSQASGLENLLPIYQGRAVCRGPINNPISNISAAQSSVVAAWTFNDVALLALADATVHTADLAAGSSTDVTATVGKVPATSAYARYGDNVYGAITDATTNPALGKWAGGGTVALQTNAPRGFRDVQVYASRLWTLGGSVPGTTTPVKTYSLFWSDANPAADLSLTASWVDDVSGLTNQLVIDADDTPVALAGASRYLAIIGSNSINILSGSGSSSFAVRNLAKGWGAKNRESVVEVDDSFFFMSTRGFCRCDGSDVSVVSDAAVTRELLSQPTAVSASLLDGYIALSYGQADFLLYSLETKTWTRISAAPLLGGFASIDVFRTSKYPFAWSNRSVWRLDEVTQPTSSSTWPVDVGASLVGIPAKWRTRAARLGSPLSSAALRRVVIDYLTVSDPAAATVPTTGWHVDVLNELGTVIATAELATYTRDPAVNDPIRQRAVIEVRGGECATLQLEISWPYTTTGVPDMMHAIELFDVYVEFTPASDQGSF